MRTSRLALVAVFALTTVACTAATAVRPPAEGGFAGYDMTADRQFRSSPSATYRQTAEKKAVKGEMRREEKHEAREEKRERTVTRTYDGEAAYRRATLQGDTYHRDGDVPHPQDDDGGDPFHADGVAGSD